MKQLEADETETNREYQSQISNLSPVRKYYLSRVAELRSKLKTELTRINRERFRAMVRAIPRYGKGEVLPQTPERHKQYQMPSLTVLSK